MFNESMVYLNKIFTDISVKSCPLLSEITTNGDTFIQQLSIFDQSGENGCGCNCGCGCGCNQTIDADDDLDFVVDTTQVFVHDFDLADPHCLKPCDVTVDGIPVDDLDIFNQRYMASTNRLMSRISDCTCLERGASTKAMLLIRGAGSWRAKITIVLRGSVFGCSSCKQFRLTMTTRDCVSLDIPGMSTFAVASICLPCTTGGLAPVINFSFDAKATLLNPQITTQTGGTCNLVVSGALVVEPLAEIQVTRQTLFRTDAEIVEQPCDALRMCQHTTRNCNCIDETEDAVAVRNRCCDDAMQQQESTSSRDNSDDGDCTCASRTTSNRQISCQWNGCNGCNNCGF